MSTRISPWINDTLSFRAVGRFSSGTCGRRKSGRLISPDLKTFEEYRLILKLSKFSAIT
jgi:hypothetical protein